MNNLKTEIATGTQIKTCGSRSLHSVVMRQGDLMTERNLGRFYFDSRWLRNNPDEVAIIFAMGKIVPVRAEMHFTSQDIEYMAISDLFPELPVGCIVPEYHLEITKLEDGGIGSVKAMPVT